MKAKNSNELLEHANSRGFTPIYYALYKYIDNNIVEDNNIHTYIKNIGTFFKNGNIEMDIPINRASTFYTDYIKLFNSQFISTQRKETSIGKKLQFTFLKNKFEELQKLIINIKYIEDKFYDTIIKELENDEDKELYTKLKAETENEIIQSKKKLKTEKNKFLLDIKFIECDIIIRILRNKIDDELKVNRINNLNNISQIITVINVNTQLQKFIRDP